MVCRPDLCNETVPVCLSVSLPVYPIYRLPHAAAAGLLLRARRSGSVDSSTAAAAANASSVALSADVGS